MKKRLRHSLWTGERKGAPLLGGRFLHVHKFAARVRSEFASKYSLNCTCTSVADLGPETWVRRTALVRPKARTNAMYQNEIENNSSPGMSPIGTQLCPTPVLTQ